MGVQRSTVRYRSTKPDESGLAEKIKQIAYKKKRFGYRRIHMMLRRENVLVNLWCKFGAVSFMLHQYNPTQTSSIQISFTLQ